MVMVLLVLFSMQRLMTSLSLDWEPAMGSVSSEAMRLEPQSQTVLDWRRSFGHAAKVFSVVHGDTHALR